jgi:hypothetical protein
MKIVLQEKIKKTLQRVNPIQILIHNKSRFKALNRDFYFFYFFCNFLIPQYVQLPEHFKEKENINETTQNHQAGYQS